MLLFLKFIFGIKLYMFQTVSLPIIRRSFSQYTQLLTACLQAVSKPAWHIPLLCVQWKTPPDDGQRNCLKHVEFYSKNKFEKLVYLVGFIIGIYHDARSPERQKCVCIWRTCLIQPPFSLLFSPQFFQIISRKQFSILCVVNTVDCCCSYTGPKCKSKLVTN